MKIWKLSKSKCGNINNVSYFQTFITYAHPYFKKSVKRLHHINMKWTSTNQMWKRFEIHSMNPLCEVNVLPKIYKQNQLFYYALHPDVSKTCLTSWLNVIVQYISTKYPTCTVQDKPKKIVMKSKRKLKLIFINRRTNSYFTRKCRHCFDIIFIFIWCVIHIRQ